MYGSNHKGLERILEALCNDAAGVNRGPFKRVIRRHSGNANLSSVFEQ